MRSNDRIVVTLLSEIELNETMMKLRNLYIRWKVWRGKALDIWSKSPYPANVLSNLCSNGFRFDGVLCGSMEGFLQSLKYQDTGKQR